MNPADPNVRPPLSGAQRARVLIVVVLVLFGLEKAVEIAAETFFGAKARQELEKVDAEIRRTLEQTSPWFVFRDFLAALESRPSAPSPAGASSPGNSGLQLNPKQPEKPASLEPSGPGKTASRFGDVGSESGAEFARRLAEEQQREKAAAAAQHELPAVSSVNPLLLPLRVPGILATVIGRAATRGPGHFLVVLLAMVAAWRITRPETGWRWWLLILVPVVAGCLIAGLYFLCQGASMALGWALRSPSVPIVLGTAFALIKIPVNMVIERRVHGRVVRLAGLFRR